MPTPEQMENRLKAFRNLQDPMGCHGTALWDLSNSPLPLQQALALDDAHSIVLIIGTIMRNPEGARKLEALIRKYS